MLKKGIKTKLVFSLVGTVLITLLVFGFISNIILRNQSKKELEKTIVFLGKNISTSLKSPLFNSDYNRIKSIVQPVILDDIDYFIVYDCSTKNAAFIDDKKGIFKSFQFENKLKDKTGFEKSRLDAGGDSYTQFLFPVAIRQVQKPLGFVIVGVSEKKMQSKLVGITYSLVIISLFIFITLTVTIYILSGKIVRPLKQLSRMVEKLAAGNYSVRSDIESDDEIGALSKDFNIMADKINEQIKSIAKYSRNLEKMVKERTKELEEALNNIKEKEEKLIRAEKISSLNSLVTSIAHEINNPMAIISGNIQIIESKSGADSTEKKRFNVVQDAIHRIETLISDMNFLTTIKDMTILNFSFSALLSRVANQIIPEDIKLKIEGCDEDNINSNQNMVTICVENVLRNSVDSIKGRDIDGEISIRYYWADTFFVIEITDNGGGIEEPDRIFEPFYTTFSDKRGLGLTFVFHAIQALNGEISVENFKNGTRVTLKLIRLSPD